MRVLGQRLNLTQLQNFLFRPVVILVTFLANFAMAFALALVSIVVHFIDVHSKHIL